MRKVLFVCTHNAGRSQMAEAFFNRLAKGKAAAVSAGTQPAKYVNPAVVEVMREVGVDISTQHPKVLTLQMLDEAAEVITMGCGVEGVCPATSAATEDWQLEDPEGKPMEKVREIRDDIQSRVRKLIDEIL